MAKRSSRKRKRQMNVTNSPSFRKGGGKRPLDDMMLELGGKIIAQQLSNKKGKFGKTIQKSKSKTKKWTVNDSDGIKYKSDKVSYKPTTISKLTQKLTQPGRTYEYTTGGSDSPQGTQKPFHLTETINVQLLKLYQALALVDPATIPAAQESRKMLFKGSIEEIEFTNCGPTTLEFDLYCLIDKITGPGSISPVTRWTEGIASEAGDAVSPFEANTTPWLQPTAYKTFNINYWTRKTSCYLTAGERCKFTFTFNRNRVLDTQYISDYGTIRGITHRFMIVHRGVLCDSDNSKVVTADHQTLSDTKLVWLIKKTIIGSVLTTLPRINKQVGNNLPLALLNLWHIDEDTGEPEDARVTTEFA